MATTQDLRDNHGNLIGRIRVDKDEQELRDAHGNLLGRYSAKQNETRDAHGNLVGKGNLLSMLLTSKK